jgi:hypothetical protein
MLTIQTCFGISSILLAEGGAPLAGHGRAARRAALPGLRGLQAAGPDRGPLYPGFPHVGFGASNK